MTKRISLCPLLLGVFTVLGLVIYLSSCYLTVLCNTLATGYWDPFQPAPTSLLTPHVTIILLTNTLAH